ncbi:hypothetical protein [Actinoplanes aureus]|uniref:hypothetical protein n=1 Tax=Actinoplanes aureus TaxID=2792083 RepID=UPI0018C27D26|nr:hypothetical protein [Actinoplanes aureus]
MSADGSDALAPRHCHAQDLAALIGLLALLEGELTAGHVPERLSRRIGSRVERAGLLAGGGSERDLRQSLSDLNHRLRYALGEYEEAPPPLAVPE